MPPPFFPPTQHASTGARVVGFDAELDARLQCEVCLAPFVDPSPTTIASLGNVAALRVAVSDVLRRLPRAARVQPMNEANVAFGIAQQQAQQIRAGLEVRCQWVC